MKHIAHLLLLYGAALAAARDPYKVLGVKRGASRSDIKQAYLAAALRWHPDKNKDPEAEARFIEISEAYRQLTEPQGRRRTGAGAGAGFGGSRPGQHDDQHLDEVLQAALKMFAESLGLEDIVENGEINWDRASSKVGGFVESAAEAAKDALRARYRHEDGSIRWKTVLGDAAVAGAAALTTLGSMLGGSDDGEDL